MKNRVSARFVRLMWVAPAFGLFAALILTSCEKTPYPDRVRYPVTTNFECNDSKPVCDQLFYAALERWYGSSIGTLLFCTENPDACANRKDVEKMWRGY